MIPLFSNKKDRTYERGVLCSTQQHIIELLQTHSIQSFSQIAVYECLLANQGILSKIPHWLSVLSEKLFNLRLRHTALFLTHPEGVVLVNFTAYGLFLENYKSYEESWERTQSKSTNILVQHNVDQSIEKMKLVELFTSHGIQKTYHEIKYNCQDFCKSMLSGLQLDNWLTKN